MAEAIAATLKNGSNAFIVLGAAHVVGDDGVVALLRRTGYRVDRLDVTWTHRVDRTLKPPTGK